MPLFSVLFASISSAVAAFIGYLEAARVALKLASYTAWIVLLAAFLVSTFVCISSILSMLSGVGGGGGGAGWVSYFMMGLGIFVPSNAAAVMACVGSVWISTSIYKVQKQGLFGFGS